VTIVDLVHRIPGLRSLICGNAMDITGGHERGACHGGTGHRLCGTGRGGVNRSRNGTQRGARQLLDYKIAEFKKQVGVGIPLAVGSDVGPSPHGTQAHELVSMVSMA